MMRSTLYVIYLQSWADRENPAAKQYLTIPKVEGKTFEQLWRRNGEWVDDIRSATFIENKTEAERIAWYYGVAFEEVQ